MTIKDFRFIKMLGKGAYGIVWLAVKESTGDQYAIKIVDAANTVRDFILFYTVNTTLYIYLRGQLRVI